MGLFDFLTRDKAPVFKIGIEEQHYPVYTNAKGETVEMTPEQYKNVQSESTPEDVSLTYGIATMPMGLGATATKGLAAKLMPHFGKKIAQQTAEGIGGGLAGGTVMGGIDAAQNGENVPLGMLTGGTIGAVTGGALGAGGGYIGKSFAKRGLLDNEQAKTNYIYDYLTGLNPDKQRKELDEFRRLQQSGYNSRPSETRILFDSTGDDFIDLTKEFEKGASFQDAKNFVNEANANEIAFETGTPDIFLDMLGNAQKRNHILRSNKVRFMNDEDKINHNIILNNFDKVAKGLKLTPNSPQLNKKPLKKPEVKKYYHFKGNVKKGDDTIPIIADAEQLIGEPDTTPLKVHLYNFYDKKFSPILNDNTSVKSGENYINSITDNLDNINPSNNLYEKIIDNYNPEIEKLAKDYFGLTDNVKEAGYILNDGSLLDFSGKKFGGSANSRSIDHREVVDAFLDNPNNINNLEIGFDEFIDNGAVRYMPENNAFFLSKMPSEQQIQRIKELLDAKNGESFIELVPKVSEWGRDNNFKRNYELWSDPKKIIDDIRTYFKGGKPSNLKDYL